MESSTADQVDRREYDGSILAVAGLVQQLTHRTPHGRRGELRHGRIHRRCFRFFMRRVVRVRPDGRRKGRQCLSLKADRLRITFWFSPAPSTLGKTF
jgi:hypothetical protein